MLRIINAALNEELFFKIAGHKLTVVEVDAVYVKPFKTDTIVIAPGQTTNAIITAGMKSGKYAMILHLWTPHQLPLTTRPQQPQSSTQAP